MPSAFNFLFALWFVYIVCILRFLNLRGTHISTLLFWHGRSHHQLHAIINKNSNFAHHLSSNLSPSGKTWKVHWTRYFPYYCWWKKSCTSWYVVYPIIYMVLYIPGGAGFLPSTVPHQFSHLTCLLVCRVFRCFFLFLRWCCFFQRCFDRNIAKSSYVELRI